TTSNLYFKGAVSDDARANWEGMIYVDPIAEKSDGYQKNENLMLSPNAHAASKPGLEILTDDVRCSHGTTITEIDPNQIFYLMSRGIPETDAKRLVIQGFFDTVLHKISYEPIRTKLQEKIYRKMD
ncbi:MAG: Fe-S cluster assembly protein SufD, partial [Flexilinea flocculi]|nr:Fe-S cluster assembly protein SufD [Flexilinea flocculi]